MDPTDFTRRHPRLFHLAHGDAWPSLSERGLLSVRSLLEQSTRDPRDREALLTQHRPDRVVLELPGSAPVVLRDQKPLNTRKLAGALTGGMTVPAWLTLLNSMVFLFPSRATLATLHDKYRSDPVTVLELDTGRLVAAYGALIRVASINTGSTVYAAAKRGRATFQGIAQFDGARPVKEVAVLDGIPDLGRYLVTAERWEPDGAARSLL